MWVDLCEAKLYQCLTSEPCYLESALWVFAQRKQGLQEKSSANAQESLILTAEDVSLFHFKQDLLWKKSIHSTSSSRELSFKTSESVQAKIYFTQMRQDKQ